jgi:hypothetical protein
MPLPSTINPDSIIAAYLVLTPVRWYQMDQNSLFTIDIHQMLKSWKPGTGGIECSAGTQNSASIDGATAKERFWGNQDGSEDWQTPNVGLNDIDAASIPIASFAKASPDLSSWQFNITSICKKWISGSALNYGVLLRAPSDQNIAGPYLSIPSFWSEVAAETAPANRPQLTIIYNAKKSDKMVAKWSFDSYKSNRFLDITGNGYDAICTKGSVNIAEGVIGNALNCTEPNFDISIPNSIGSFKLNTFTIQSWIYSYINLVNPGSFFNAHKIFEFADAMQVPHTARGYALHVAAEGVLQAALSSTDNQSWITALSDSILLPKRWYHVASTYDGTMIKTYTNGKLVKQQPYTNFICPDMIAEARIGCEYLPENPPVLRNWFNGKIDELELFNYALSPDSILSYYTKNRPPEETPFEINFGMKTSYAKAGDTVCMPIMLANFEEYSINSCQFTLNYDTSSVSFLTMSKDSGLIKKWQLFDWSVANTNKGSINAAMGGISTPLPYGEGEFVRCYFVVKRDSLKDDTTQISLTNINIDENKNIITATTQNGRIIIDNPTILYGDVTGNGDVTVLDAIKVLSNVIGTLVLPDSTCPNFSRIVADVSGNGTITSYDAALIFQYSLGLISEFPVQKKKLAKSKAALSPTATISLKVTNNGQDGVSYDIVGTNIKGCRSADLILSCDPLDRVANGILFTNIKTGTLLSKTESSQKWIKIALATKDDIDENSEITLATLVIPPPGTASLPKLEILSAAINEGLITSSINNQIPTAQNPKSASHTKTTVSLVHNNLFLRNLQSDATEFQIWSLNGRLVFQKRFSAQQNHEFTINLQTLNRGTYLYKLKSGSTEQTRRLCITQ